MHVKLELKLLFCTLFFHLFIMQNVVVLKAQTGNPIREYCLPPKIHTVLLYRSGWDLSMPVIMLDEDESLEFRFDYLGEPEKDFSFSLAKCTYNWQISNISEHDYLDGFNDVSLFDFEPSRNTNVYYTHYAAQIPNEDLRITRNGNYIIRLYESSYPDSVLLVRKFAVVERKVAISARIDRPDREHQEILMQVDLKTLKTINPLQEIKVIIIKNYDWNNRVKINSKPVLRNRVLHYDMPYQILAKGGNEFRHVDTKDPDFIAKGIDNIEYRSPYYCYYLLPDKLKQFDPYFSDRDLNGRSFYEVPDAQDRHLEADYVRVFFRLETMQPLGTDVYIYGALTDWKTDSSNYMLYDPESGMYKRDLILKQGMLNYAYAMRDFNSRDINFDITEGNHDETENDYLIFVYYRGLMSDYDELVGYEVFNSTNN